ncbi:MAG: hypothetical protein AAF368_07735 [Planctomycetota bacterium]
MTNEYLSAFARGGVGCLGAFIVLAFLAVSFGGTATFDVLGSLLVFVIGGILGLVVRSVYDKGRQDGMRSDDAS